MNRNHLALWARVVVGASALLGGGCAAPALLATAGLSAAREGTSAWSRGELAAAEVATLDEVRRATLAALERLRFAVDIDRVREHEVYIEAQDMGSSAIKVRISRRTEAVTKIRIRIGPFGDQPMSRLILQETQWELDRARQSQVGEDGMPLPGVSGDITR